MNYLAFDIGGSFIKYGLISQKHKIKESSKFETPLESKELFIERVKEVYEKYKEKIAGIAISMPGKIDVYNGYAHSAGILHYLEETNIVELFQTFADVPVAVENDGKCAALAEAWYGSLKNVESGMVIVFGTGVAGGLVFNNRLYRGFNSIAGEFSFMTGHDSTGSHTLFGSEGSVFTLTNDVEKRKNVAKNSLTGEAVFRLVLEGDYDANQALDSYCDIIAEKLFNFQHILDPEMISIGGGISEQTVFIDRLNERMDVLIEKISPYVLIRPTIVQSTYRNEANLLGALANFHINKVKIFQEPVGPSIDAEINLKVSE